MISVRIGDQIFWYQAWLNFFILKGLFILYNLEFFQPYFSDFALSFSVVSKFYQVSKVCFEGFEDETVLYN